MARSRSPSTAVRAADSGVKARAAAVSAACSSARQADGRRGRVVLQLLHTGGARDDDDPRQPDEPGQRDLCRPRLVCVGHLAKEIEQRRDPVQVLGAEQRVDRADAARPVVGGVAATEQPLGQRAVGDHEPVLPLGERHQVVERRGVGQGELHLVADHRAAERGVGGPPAVQRVVGDARPRRSGRRRAGSAARA